MKTRNPVLRPVLGFGMWGWSLSLIAVALGVSLATDYDLRFKFLALVNFCFGWGGLNWVVSHWLTAQYLSLFGPQFGPLGLMSLLVAMHVAPDRQSWWRWTLAAAWALLCPLVWFQSIGWVSTGVRPFMATHFPTVAGIDPSTAAAIPMVLFTGIVLLLLTRSWIVVEVYIVSSLAFELLFAALLSGLTPVMPSPNLLVVLFHLTNAATMLAVAIHRRRTVPSPGRCKACRYDLSGLALGVVCPECGTARA